MLRACVPMVSLTFACHCASAECLVEWSTEFAADVDAKTIDFESKTILQNLKDLRTSLIQLKKA